MTDTFPYAAIKDVAEVKGGKRLPKGSELRSAPSPFPYIRVTDVREGTIAVQQLLFVPPEVQPQISRYTISSDDIFVSIVGTVGLVAKIPKSISGANLTENAAKIVCDPKKVDNRFLRFFLQSDAGQAKIREQTVGSTQSKLALFRLGDIKFPFPDLNNQRRIADVLSVLDDKIELNRRMNETLEAMAQAIFRDWFVDFGPTRRKLEGATDPITIMGGLVQDAERAQALADLFPAALGDDGLPEGWKTVELADSFETVMGQSPPGSSYNENGTGLPFFQGRRDFGFRFPQNRVYCSSPSRIAEDDWTLISVRAPVGDVNRSKERCSIGRGVGAIHHKQKLSSLTYYTILELRPLLARFDGDGTVFGSINQKQIRSLPVVRVSVFIKPSFAPIFCRRG